jgi:hypothetical protein
MFTVCGVVYVPVAGVIDGVAAVGMLSVITEVATLLFANPLATPIALTVVVVFAMNDPTYSVELVVGVDPFVV